MNEANNSQVNVDELMQKIRAEVAKRRNSARQIGLKDKPKTMNFTPKFYSNLELIESYLKNAELRAEVRTKWPDNLNRFPFNLSQKIQNFPLKILNFIFKDQREVNYNLIRALKESVALNRQLIEQVTALRTQIDERLSATEAHYNSVDERLATTEARCNSVDERLATAEARFNSVDERLAATDTRFTSINEHLTATNTRFTSVDERLAATDTRFTSINEHLTAKDLRLQELGDRLNIFDSSLQSVGDRLSNVDFHLHKVEERHLTNDSYLKNDLIQQKRLLSIFLEEAKKRLPEPFNQEQLQTFVNEEKHLLDALYTAFEDRFRGSREEIKNRLKTYIPFVEKALESCDYAPTIDIGCGRGEWLELLSECGIKSSGVDINSTMVQYCQERNLDAVEGDGLLYLRNIPDNSLAIVTAFHVIEHLPLQHLISLIEEALRVIRPGGMVIFETPNPENLIVGACNFYFDPTHRNPIPPATAQFLLENRGFSQVEIQRLHPVGIDHNLDNQFLKDVLLGCQDYAVIGWKQ